MLFGSSLLSQGCGGALVADRYVITAAHCTNGRVASDLKIAVGDTTFALTGEASSFIINVKTIKQHPDYSSSNTQNDISILELEQPVDLTAYPNIKPICLPAQDTTYADQEATVSGWGTLSSGGDLVAHLQEVDVTVFADGNCGMMDSYMTPDMMCAGVKEGGKDSCQGDSGGPLFTSDLANNNAQTLIGVVSWGFGCAAAGQLGVYAEVSHFRSWIDSQLTNSNTCSPPSSSGTTGTSSSGSTTTPSTVVSPTTSSNTSATTTAGSSVTGSGSCGNCVFPFTFAGRLHTTCTKIDGDAKAWCSTLVDESGVHVSGGGNWEYCEDPSCPGVNPPAMCAHPNNAAGSCGRSQTFLSLTSPQLVESLMHLRQTRRLWEETRQRWGSTHGRWAKTFLKG